MIWFCVEMRHSIKLFSMMGILLQGSIKLSLPAHYTVKSTDSLRVKIPIGSIA